MIVLIPASLFRIAYEVGSGRPYSRFEALLLRAVSEGASSVNDLRGTFHVHPRLIVDALVSLTREGWLAVGAGEGPSFLLTASGRVALKTGREPESRVLNTRQTHVIMERLTGSLARNDEVRLVSDKQVRELKAKVLRLRPDVTSNSVLEGQVAPLLYRKRGHWLGQIGPMDMVTKGSWAPVTVDNDGLRIVGLPESWSKLAITILDEARAARDFDAEARAMVWEGAAFGRQTGGRVEDGAEEDLTPAGHQVALSREHLLAGEPAHDKFLRRSLAEASGSILIGTGDIDTASLEDLRAPLTAALERGVLVDILWNGLVGDAMKGVAEWLKKFAYDARRASWTGELRFNAEPAGVTANMVVVDTTYGAIGSAPWLAGRKAEPSHWSASIVVLSDSLLVQMMRVGAGLWSAAPGMELSSTADRWRVISSRLDEDLSGKADSMAGASVQAHLIADREHEVEWADAILAARRRIVVAAPDMSIVENMFQRTLGRSGLPVGIDVSVITSGDETTIGSGVLEGVATRVIRRPGLHGIIVIGDRRACISNAEEMQAGGSRGLGIAVEGGEIVDSLAEALLRGEQQGMPSAMPLPE